MLRMIGHAPVYVLACEALVLLALPVVVARAAQRPPACSAALGALAGLWIWGAAVITFALLR